MSKQIDCFYLFILQFVHPKIVPVEEPIYMEDVNVFRNENLPGVRTKC